MCFFDMDIAFVCFFEKIREILLHFYENSVIIER